MNRRAALALVVSLVAVQVTACGGPPAKAPTVSLKLAGTPPSATVTIDDQRLGPLAYVAKRGVALPKGRHRVTVEADGYFPWDRLVEADGGPIVLQVELTKIPE